MENGKITKKYADDQVIEIDLRQVFSVLWHRLIIILIVAAACAAVVFFACKLFITPEYTSTTSIMVINRQAEGTITNSDLTSANYLSKDYVQIIKSTTVLDKVISELNLPESLSQLKNKITTANVADTRIIKINVEDPEPQRAKTIADEVAKISSDRISDVMGIPDMVSTIDVGNLPTSPSSPATMKYTAVAFILGFLLMWLIFVIIVLADSKIYTVADIEKYLSVPTLGIIPNTDKKQVNKEIKQEKRKAAEKAHAVGKEER